MLSMNLNTLSSAVSKKEKQMSKKTHDLCVKVGSYEKDGKQKNRYLNIGAMFEGDKSPYILLNKTFNPAGIVDDKASVMVSMFSKDKPENGQETINAEDIAWQD